MFSIFLLPSPLWSRLILSWNGISSSSTSLSRRLGFVSTLYVRVCAWRCCAAYLFLPSSGFWLIHFPRLPSQNSETFLKKTGQSSTLEIPPPFSLKMKMKTKLIFLIQFKLVKPKPQPGRSEGRMKERWPQEGVTSMNRRECVCSRLTVRSLSSAHI